MDDHEIDESPLENTCRTTKDQWVDTDASSFFRIITPSVVHEHKLGLPQMFVKEYSAELSTTIRLCVPTGGIWNVEIERSSNMLWLCDGWQRFMEHHSIKCAYFLSFKYKGNSEFCVFIFDLTATEIEYPGSTNNKTSNYVAQVSMSEQEKVCSDENDEPIEISDSLESSLNFRSLDHNSSAKSPNGKEDGKKRKTDFEPIEISDSSESSLNFRSFDHNSSAKSAHGKEDGRKQKTSRYTDKQVNGSADGPKIISSADSNWTYSHRKNYKTGGASDKEKMRELQVTRMYKTENPYYTRTMRHYSLSYSFIVHVPAEFARTFLKGLPNSIQLQDSDGKIWRVGTIKTYGRVTSLSRGWSQFVKEKELCLGDVCVFELIKPTDLVIKVSIFHARDLAKLN